MNGKVGGQSTELALNINLIIEYN